MDVWQWIAVVTVGLQSIPLTVIDIREHRLPNVWVLPGYLVIFACWVGMFLSGDEELLSSVISAGGYFLALFALSWLGGMGFGDVKLAGVLGAAAGMFSFVTTIGVVFCSFFTAALFSSGVLIFSPRQGIGMWEKVRTTRIPFGPFMLLGFWLAIAVSLLVRWK